MKKARFASDFSVGFVLFVATVVVVSSLFLVGDGQSLFTDHVEYTVRCNNVSGLKEGAQIWLAGFPVGTVLRIEFPDDLSSSDVIVTLSIEEEHAARIRGDSFAWLETQGLLGDQTVRVKVGTAGEEPLEPGSMIPYKERAMLDTFAGAEVRESATYLIKTMVEVLEEVNRGQGTLGQLLKNPELYNNLSQFTQAMATTTLQVERVSKEVEGILANVKAQKGTLGKLVFSEEYAQGFASTLKEASQLVGDLRELADAVKAGKGTVGKLFAEQGMHDAAKDALEDLSGLAQRLDRALEKAEASGSVAGRLLSDGEMGRRAGGLLARLEEAAGHLEKILARVERGEGSLGVLVHDPSIATSLRDVFRGVREAGVLANVVQSAERDGREAYLRDLSLAEKEREEVLRVRALARMRGGGEEPADGGAKPVPAAGPEEDKKKE
ncbi:MAG: MCE family protein [Planctomycetes bacterium]|nr:MCE family protein [Planctomycetota bacterium]